LAGNTPIPISGGSTVIKAMWEASKFFNHYGYRLKGNAGSKRSVPMTNMTSSATRF
jgi:hypothetical protein